MSVPGGDEAIPFPGPRSEASTCPCQAGTRHCRRSAHPGEHPPRVSRGSWRGRGAGRCGLLHVPTGCDRARHAVQLLSTPDRYAPGSKLCRYERPSRRQAHSVRRALSYPGVDGGAPGHGVGHGTSVPTSPATRTVPATGFRPLAGAEARPPRARLSASARSPSSSQPRLKPRPPPRTAHPPPVKPRPPLRTARPPPVKPRPPLSPGKGHFRAISGRQGRLEFHRTRRPTTQGRLEFHPATRLPLATVEMSQTAASRARLPHDRAQRGSTTGLRARPGQRSGGRRACVSPRSAANRFT